nr:active breakpoint cluster region-related protein isoform X9 [Symphalangus syndactylus]
MWDPRAFERRWRAEFPGAEAPVPRLESVRDAERELERCRLNLERLQQVLAEERLKASLLQAALAGGGGGDSGDRGRPDPEAESPRGDPGRPDREAESPRADLPAGPGAPGEAGGGRSWADAVHQQLLQPQLRFRAREDDAPLGDPHAAPGTDEGGDGSDHDFEMVDFNEKFVLSHWLVAPCRFGTREEAERPGRACNPHRWMHLIPGGRRPQRGTRDLEQPEAKDRPGSPLATEETRRREHLPAWRRQRFLRVPERDSPGHSSPERDSDGSRHSSDREDGFSAGCSVCWGHMQTSRKVHGPHQPPLRTRFLLRRRRLASWLSRSLGAREEGEGLGPSSFPAGLVPRVHV